MVVGEGNTDQIMRQGNLIYIKASDGHFYPTRGGTDGSIYIGQQEPFEFRPGQTALASGAVPAGTRTASGTITTAASANVTYWGSWVSYAPYRAGKIDGLATGGIIEGQLTFGIKSAAGTVNAKVTAQIANTANTGSPTTFVALSAATSVTTAETYVTYDINYLQTNTVFNAVPFSVRMGVETAVAASAVIGRMMESSAIRGLFEPGT